MSLTGLPWGLLALTILGSIGTIVASREFFRDFIAMHDADPQATWTWRQRLPLLRWSALVLLFGAAGLVGDIGLIEFLARRI